MAINESVSDDEPQAGATPRIRLLSCPFCGADSAYFNVSFRSFHHFWWVTCGDCGAQGPSVASQVTAAKAWHFPPRRPHKPVSGAEVEESWFCAKCGHPENTKLTRCSHCGNERHGEPPKAEGT